MTYANLAKAERDGDGAANMEGATTERRNEEELEGGNDGGTKGKGWGEYKRDKASAEKDMSREGETRPELVEQVSNLSASRPASSRPTTSASRPARPEGSRGAEQPPQPQQQRSVDLYTPDLVLSDEVRLALSRGMLSGASPSLRGLAKPELGEDQRDRATIPLFDRPLTRSELRGVLTAVAARTRETGRLSRIEDEYLFYLLRDADATELAEAIRYIYSTNLDTLTRVYHQGCLGGSTAALPDLIRVAADLFLVDADALQRTINARVTSEAQRAELSARLCGMIRDRLVRLGATIGAGPAGGEEAARAAAAAAAREEAERIRRYDTRMALLRHGDVSNAANSVRQMSLLSGAAALGTGVLLGLLGFGLGSLIPTAAIVGSAVWLASRSREAVERSRESLPRDTPRLVSSMAERELVPLRPTYSREASSVRRPPAYEPQSSRSASSSRSRSLLVL